MNEWIPLGYLGMFIILVLATFLKDLEARHRALVCACVYMFFFQVYLAVIEDNIYLGSYYIFVAFFWAWFGSQSTLTWNKFKKELARIRKISDKNKKKDCQVILSPEKLVFTSLDLSL